MNQHPAAHPEFDARASAGDRDQLCIDTIRMLIVMREFGFTPEHVVDTAKAILRQNTSS